MRWRLLSTLILLLGFFVSTAAPALAHNNGRGRGKGKGVVVRRWDGHRDRRHRGRAVIVTQRPVRTRNVAFFGSGFDHPPGWSRGRKVGWGNCNLPPGQAKKYGCTPAFLRRSVLVRYPLANNRFWIVRVPTDFRGWYVIDNGNRLWVDDRGRFWLDNRRSVPLVIITD
ncbi:MAG TPA: hypothetical protein VNK82_00310 [Terriglobales bacterium]|nr:hypothetical protein [Terriglobales bacterium]